MRVDTSLADHRGRDRPCAWLPCAARALVARDRDWDSRCACSASPRSSRSAATRSRAERPSRCGGCGRCDGGRIQGRRTTPSHCPPERPARRSDVARRSTSSEVSDSNWERGPLGARASWCAVQRHTLSAGVIPARQVSFQPVALGTVVEATKRLKHSEKRVRRDSASMQAVTRSERRAGPENSECGSRSRQDREKAAATRGSERHEHPRGSAGVVATACMYKGGCATREAPVGGRKRCGPTAAS